MLWYHVSMTLEEIATAIRQEGYEVELSDDSLLVSHRGQQIEWLTLVDEYLGGAAVLLESSEEGIQYEVRQGKDQIEMDLLFEAFSDHRESVDEE